MLSLRQFLSERFFSVRQTDQHKAAGHHLKRIVVAGLKARLAQPFAGQRDARRAGIKTFWTIAHNKSALGFGCGDV